MYFFIYIYFFLATLCRLHYQGLNLGPWQWKHQVLTTGTPGNFTWHVFFFFLFFFFFLSLLGLGCCAGFLWLQPVGATLHCGARASHCGGFSCCGAQALGTWASVVEARGLSSCGSQALERRLSSCGVGSVALRHVGSSWTRVRTHVPCIGRQILNPWTTREVPEYISDCWTVIIQTENEKSFS